MLSPFIRTLRPSATEAKSVLLADAVSLLAAYSTNNRAGERDLPIEAAQGARARPLRVNGGLQCGDVVRQSFAGPMSTMRPFIRWITRFPSFGGAGFGVAGFGGAGFDSRTFAFWIKASIASAAASRMRGT